MSGTVLAGRGTEILEVSDQPWRAALTHAPEETRRHLAFMTEDHHRVRRFVVMELVRTAAPIAPETISGRLRLPLPQVSAILEELEKNLFFLVRDAAGEVSWAFPVTAERTPHHLAFSSGERLWAA